MNDQDLDLINNPPHYTHGGIETIDVIEAWQLGFHLGNAVKYIARADHKGSRLDDLRKAAWYIAREIERTEEAQSAPVDTRLKDQMVNLDVGGES